MNSPFFDHTSNNAVLTSQAQFNPGMFAAIQDRTQFEKLLSGMSGIEYIVAEEPSAAKQHENPVWVIKQQERHRDRDETIGLDLLNIYYVVGQFVYEAPSIERVLQSKLVGCSLLVSLSRSALTKL